MTTFKNNNAGPSPIDEPAYNTESEVVVLKARIKELEEGLMLCAKALTSKESFQIVKNLLGGDS